MVTTGKRASTTRIFTDVQQGASDMNQSTQGVGISPYRALETGMVYEVVTISEDICKLSQWQKSTLILDSIWAVL